MEDVERKKEAFVGLLVAQTTAVSHESEATGRIKKDD